MKRAITWNKPEIRNNLDECTPEYPDYVWNIITRLSFDFKPNFISFHQQVKKLEKNGIYIGCNVKNVPNFRTGITKKLISNYSEMNPGIDLKAVLIHPGTFSYYMGYNNNVLLVFAYYAEFNSIAMIDLFDPLYRTTSGSPNSGKKLESFLKVLFSIYKKSFKDFKDSKKSVIEIQKELDNISIGADPEFSVIKKNDDAHFVSAFTIAKSQLEFPIGADGHQSILELRPEWSYDVDTFIKNVENIIFEASELLDSNQYDIITGGGSWDNEPLGGHIHFSNMTPTTELLIMLDSYIGNPLKGCQGGKRPRSNQNYDLPSQQRPKDYGENKDIKGFEYRSCPSFYTDPMLTKGVYIVAYLIAKTYKYCKETKTEFEYDDPISHNDFKRLIDYEKYKECIDYFWEFVSKKKKLTGKVFENWKIDKVKKLINVKVLSSDDKLLDQILPASVDIYKPVFNKVKFYGIADSNAPVSLVNIDSIYIDTNVNMGWIHRWMRDLIPDVSILNSYQITENIQDFVDNGILHIGLSMPLRESISKLDSTLKSLFINTFLKRLCVYTRFAIKDQSTLDKDNANEVKEFEKIKLILGH